MSEFVEIQSRTFAAEDGQVQIIFGAPVAQPGKAILLLVGDDGGWQRAVIDVDMMLDALQAAKGAQPL